VIGLENSKTTITYNDQVIKPGIQFSPQLGVKMNYTFKKGHGVFAGISTSSPVMDFSFTDPQSAASSYLISRDDIKLRFEGGYQFSSKPIYFSKNRSNSSSSKNVSCQRKSFSCQGRSYSCQGKSVSCQGRASCGPNKGHCDKNAKTTSKNAGQYMRIIPSAGLAFIPGQSSEIITGSKNGSPLYSYKAGAWNTAVVAGTSFEFGSNRHANFILSVNYLKGIGNMDAKTVNTVSNGKSISGNFSSAVSNWNIGVGIPISLSKRKPVMHNRPRPDFDRKFDPSQRFESHGRCGQYRMFMR
jgi:hypothetical protein